MNYDELEEYMNNLRKRMKWNFNDIILLIVIIIILFI